MRYLVSGTGADGRSRIVHESSLDGDDVLTTLATFDFADIKVEAPSAPVDIGVAEGTGSWMLFRPPPGAELGMHRTDTIDLRVVLEGSCHVLLDDGPVELRAGDLLRCDGAVHGWHIGAEGCTLAIFSLGATPA